MGINKNTTTMHAKSDSDLTSLGEQDQTLTLTPPRTPRHHRPLYYVQSPSNHDHDKMSFGSSPFGSPGHHHYHCSPIHHSRESSTSRTFSASVKNALVKHGGRDVTPWKRIEDGEVEDDDEGEGGGGGRRYDGVPLRFYVMWFVVSFVCLFSVFALILWAASVPYKPNVFLKSMVFDNFYVQSGMDATGVPTDMLTLNSTVRIFFRNPATFFGVHVTVSPVEIYYYQLKFASGHVKKFYQSRKSQRVIVAQVLGYQMPLYGGVAPFDAAIGHLKNVIVPVNLTFVMRSRAYVLGRLVKPKFYKKVLCRVTLYGNRIGKHVNLTDSCIYRD